MQPLTFDLGDRAPVLLGLGQSLELGVELAWCCRKHQ